MFLALRVKRFFFGPAPPVVVRALAGPRFASWAAKSCSRSSPSTNVATSGRGAFSMAAARSAMAPSSFGSTTMAPLTSTSSSPGLTTSKPSEPRFVASTTTNFRPTSP